MNFYETSLWRSKLEILFYCFLTGLTSCFGFYIFHKWESKKIRSSSEDVLMQCRELEKTVHVKETLFLEEKNKKELEYQQSLKQAKENSYAEGFSVGKMHNEKDHKIEIIKLQSELTEKMIMEKEVSAKSAREVLKAEFESQNKLFSISIHPYVKVIKDEGFFNKEYKSHVGYQYQLLINGIPAFQPHVVVEKTEEHKEFDQALKTQLVSIASGAAKTAAEIYLGGVQSSVLKMGHEIFAEEKAV